MKRKVLFIIPSLSGGGAERVFSLLVRHLDRNEFDPRLALLKKEGPFLADVPEDVEVIDLKCEKSRYSPVKIIRLVRQMQPDIVFTTLGYLNLISLMAGVFYPKTVKTVIRESTYVSESLKLEKYGRLFVRLYRRLYKKADRIICLSESMKGDLLSRFDIPEGRVTMIPNPVEYHEIRRRAEAETEPELAGKLDETERERTLLAVGRLEYEKGHDLLIQALAFLPKDVRVILAGSGSRREDLEKLAESGGFRDRVIFAGFQSNPFSLTRYASVFVFPSRYEGFGSALVEALACGLPAVSFAGPTAAREIIRPGFNGFLSEKIDPEHLAEAIGKALDNEFDGKAIAGDAEERFDVRRIIPRYEDVFRHV